MRLVRGEQVGPVSEDVGELAEASDESCASVSPEMPVKTAVPMSRSMTSFLMSPSSASVY